MEIQPALLGKNRTREVTTPHPQFGEMANSALADL